MLSSQLIQNNNYHCYQQYLLSTVDSVCSAEASPQTVWIGHLLFSFTSLPQGFVDCMICISSPNR